MPNIDAERLASSLRRLAKPAEEDVAAAVGEAVNAAVTLFHVSGSGLMIADDEDNLRYVAAGNGTSHLMEMAQIEAGEGPCVSSFVTNEVITTDDMATETRWPSIRETFLRHGIVSVLGVPVRLGGVPVGSLDVFFDEPHKWDDSERTALRRYADVVQATLGAALSAHRAGELAGQLQYALDYRIVIERAVGFLMAKRGADPVQAFDQLRRAARSQRRKVAEVAQQLLDTGSLPPPG
jgi:GAF domain-containing protein